MKNLIVIFAFGLLALSCKKEKQQSAETINAFEKIEQLQWLVGNWSNISEEEQSYENWIKRDDSTLTAHSFTMVENDTVFAERVTLQQRDETVYFQVVAYNQNDDDPITFTMIPSENNVFTFENSNHDFPSRITYSNSVKDSIHAWIEGKVNDEARKVDFYFKREH